MRLAGFDLDRKVLADLAVSEPEAFGALASQVKNALEGRPVERRISLGEAGR